MTEDERLSAPATSQEKRWLDYDGRRRILVGDGTDLFLAWVGSSFDFYVKADSRLEALAAAKRFVGENFKVDIGLVKQDFLG
jgi:hypothetical protein